jgi:hypothetical protein
MRCWRTPRFKVAALKATLPLADIIYWVLPITASGRFSS